MSTSFSTRRAFDDIATALPQVREIVPRTNVGHDLKSHQLGTLGAARRDHASASDTKRQHANHLLPSDQRDLMQRALACRTTSVSAWLVVKREFAAE